MPIHEYVCPEGHTQEILYLAHKPVPVQVTCPEHVTHIQTRTNKPETFLCGLPSRKITSALGYVKMDPSWRAGG